jgi:hypothetical protein
MQLTNLEVSPAPAPYSVGSVLVAGYYGKQRVNAVLDPVDLDDYFKKGYPHLDDAQRRILVDGNKEIIGRLMQKKCEAGEWKDEELSGGMVKKVEISRAELFDVVPRLSDDRLKVFQGAGFQKR